MSLGKPEVLINRIDKENYQNPSEIATEKQPETFSPALES